MKTLYSFNDWWSYLAHSGIMGQKWGVKNGPPYPLNPTVSRAIKSGHNPGGQSKASKAKDGFWAPETDEDYEMRDLVFMDLEETMGKISYDSSEHSLKSPEEVEKDKSGNCHDQTFYELKYLKDLGLTDAKAKFLVDVDAETGQGGTTHSFVYFNLYNDGSPGDKIVWFENAWDSNKGFHYYDSMDELVRDVEDRFEKDSNSKGYDDIIWGDFDDSVIKPGDTLQDIVDKCLEDDEE